MPLNKLIFGLFPLIFPCSLRFLKAEFIISFAICKQYFGAGIVPKKAIDFSDYISYTKTRLIRLEFVLAGKWFEKGNKTEWPH